MSELKDELKLARECVVICRQHVDDANRRADAEAAKLTATCKELRNLEGLLERTLQAVASLEAAVAVEEQQAPIARAFNHMGHRSLLMQGDPTHHKALQS